MKKVAISLVAAISAIIMCIALAACSTNVVGTYKFAAMKGSYGGISVDVKVGDKLMDTIELTEDFMVITLNEDNTATMSAMGQETKATWKEEGGKYYLVVGSDSTEFKVSGNTLTFSQEGAEVTLKK